MATERILIVEDEMVVSLDIEEMLVQAGYEVMGILCTGQAAIEKVAETPPDLILMDIVLKGDMDGIEAARRIHDNFDIPIIFLTAHSDKATLDRAKIGDPNGYIVKPFYKGTLQATIEMTIYKHRINAKLKEKDENFMNLAEGANDGILIATVDGSHVYANRRATAITGCSVPQLQEKCLGEIASPGEDGSGSEGCLDGTSFRKKEITIDREGERTISLEMTCTETVWHGQPAVLSLLRDITQLKRTEEERNGLRAYMERVRNMEALGTLARGVAHNINNLLAVILGFTELSIDRLPEEHPVGANLEKVLNACLQAKDVVNQVMTFSHPVDKDLELVKIGPLIQKSLKLLRSAVPSNVQVRQKIEATSDVVLGSPVQLSQVFINLCENAIQAMKEKGGGLEILLEEVDLNRAAATAVGGLKGSHFLKLTVGDTGRGMEPGVMDRIFDPFFTTHEVGEGIGMGLAVIHGVIKSHGGAITVQSEPGKGSTFQVYLPKSEEEIPTEVVEISGYIPRGQERILVADDEEAVLDVIKRMLEYLGYRVEATTSSLDALELFESGPDRFDLVIIDMIMPEMTGTELARKVLQTRPGMPIVICTGLSEKTGEKEIKALGIDDIVTKPVVMQQIAQVIRRVLERTGKKTEEKPSH